MTKQFPLPPVDVETKLRPDFKAHVMELFPDLFDRISTIKDAVIKLDIDQTVPPVIQPPRKIPQAMVNLLKQEIKRMLHLGVIRKLDMNEATDWCHNLVIVCKPNCKLRVCLDPRTINRALRFNVHNARTFQGCDVICKENNQGVRKIDTNSRFWTMPMDGQSQLLMTFNTPWGWYCFTKMPFGLNQAQYFFQYYLDQHFQNINPTTNVIADWHHDPWWDRWPTWQTSPGQVLNKCREIGLKLNPDNCSFGKSEVKFYDNVVGKEGIKPDSAKVDVIIKMPTPQNKTELASFLGMCNYMVLYIPCLSDITETLRQLNKKAVRIHMEPDLW